MWRRDANTDTKVKTIYGSIEASQAVALSSLKEMENDPVGSDVPWIVW